MARRRTIKSLDPSHRRMILRTAWHNWEARNRGQNGRITAKSVAACLDRQDGTCFYCFDPLNDDFQIDHRIPKSRGGENTPANIVVCCPPCNRSKYRMTVEEYERTIEIKELSRSKEA